MSAPIHDILAAADELLHPARFDDYCVNGLQVPGPPSAETLVSGVSASAELFGLAANAGADLVLVHHGMFWGSGIRVIDAVTKGRLQALFENEIALAAYHLPLDAHPEIGNNAQLARELGAVELSPFARHGTETIGCLGTIPGEGVPLADLLARTRLATNREPLVFDVGPQTVQRVAVVTGAGAGYLEEAAAAGAQAFVTGEVPERAMALAREVGVTLIAAGHYATETFGIRRLGGLLAERFGCEHEFIDVPNPV
jgi:dinuclear metal center YbgI/SA1388 family protein